MKLNRRKFITTSTLAGGSLFLNQSKAKALNFKISADFSLTILATMWGFQGSFEQFCAKAKADGYDGIEVWLPGKADQQRELFDALEKHDLKYGFLAGSGASDFETHLEQFQTNVKAAADKQPLFVNCHSGRDYFSFDQNSQLIEFAEEWQQESGVPIYHETHRARILFAAHITKTYLEKYPNLRLTLDISHWCNVHASLLADQQESVDLALARTNHVHSRIGHSNSPQVSDPRAPEWESSVDAHLNWWDKVVEAKVKAGKPLTMTTEFGPPTYMPTLPFTNQPVTDLWTINAHMKDLWRERYAKKN